MNQSLHFAFSGKDGNGISKDVSLLIDGDGFDLTDTCRMAKAIEAFLRSSGLLEAGESVVIIG